MQRERPTLNSDDAINRHATSATTLKCSLVTVLTTGCAMRRPSLYQTWGKQLSETGITIRTVEDVSFLLGSPPTRCDSIQPTPVIGIRFRPDNAMVFWVDPTGAAAAAGIQAGERILKINEVQITVGNDAITALRSNLRGEPVTIVTTAQMYTIKPKVPAEAKQCYWDISAGAVAKTSGGAYVNEYSGSAGHSGSAYDRFFRASCRFYDGVVAGCQSNWQE
jgi:PDZ domain